MYQHHSRGSRMSLTSSIRGADEEDVLTDYGDDDSSKFGEDGSFIGQYVPRKARGVDAPSAGHIQGTATFV